MLVNVNNWLWQCHGCFCALSLATKQLFSALGIVAQLCFQPDLKIPENLAVAIQACSNAYWLHASAYVQTPYTHMHTYIIKKICNCVRPHTTYSMPWGNSNLPHTDMWNCYCRFCNYECIIIISDFIHVLYIIHLPPNLPWYCTVIEDWWSNSKASLQRCRSLNSKELGQCMQVWKVEFPVTFKDNDDCCVQESGNVD